MSTATTDIQVETQFLPEHSVEDQTKYAFAYQVTITNKADYAVTLLSRYWLLTDANGKKTEVQGEGVVGEQPTIEPQQSYQYVSGAVVETPVASMQGYYEMKQANGETYQAPIVPFRLSVPGLIN